MLRVWVTSSGRDAGVDQKIQNYHLESTGEADKAGLDEKEREAAGKDTHYNKETEKADTYVCMHAKTENMCSTATGQQAITQSAGHNMCIRMGGNVGTGQNWERMCGTRHAKIMRSGLYTFKGSHARSRGGTHTSAPISQNTNSARV